MAEVDKGFLESFKMHFFKLSLEEQEQIKGALALSFDFDPKMRKKLCHLSEDEERTYLLSIEDNYSLAELLFDQLLLDHVGDKRNQVWYEALRSMDKEYCYLIFDALIERIQEEGIEIDFPIEHETTIALR